MSETGESSTSPPAFRETLIEVAAEAMDHLQRSPGGPWPVSTPSTWPLFAAAAVDAVLAEQEAMEDNLRAGLWERFSDQELAVLLEGIECATDEGMYAPGPAGGPAVGLWELAQAFEREIEAELDRRAIAGTTR